MSHHLDSPLARRDPRLNITDQYVFEGGGATVLVMDVNTSLGGGTPGFHPEGRYEFKVHLDTAAQESVCFRFAFQPSAPDGTQRYVLHRLDGAAAADDNAVQSAVLSGTTGEVATGAVDAGLRVWAGRALDPFYLDLDRLKAVIEAVQHGQDLDTSSWSTPTTNTFDGATVWAIVLSVPHTDLVLQPGQQIGVWSRTVLARDAGGWAQTNRAGIPMIWPVFRDDHSEAASRADQGHPAHDVEHYAPSMTDLLTAFTARGGAVADPDSYARTLVSRLTPDVLPYLVGSPAGFTFAGFQGRDLGDNAPEVLFSLAANRAVPTGLGRAVTSHLRRATFPHLVPA